MLTWLSFLGTGIKFLCGVALLSESLTAADPLVSILGGLLSAVPLAQLIARHTAPEL